MMPPAARFLIGLLAVVLLAWLYHGPLGNGARYIDRLDAEARQAVAAGELPGIHVELQRRPLARVATLSGPADEFQRYGMGSQKGLTQMVGDVGGIGRVVWADRPHGGLVIPLLAEGIALSMLGYLIGLGIAWLVWGRERRQGYA